MLLLCPGVDVMNLDLKKHNIHKSPGHNPGFFIFRHTKQNNMSINNTTTTLKRDVIRAFATLDGWFDKEEDFHRYKPPGDQRTFQHATEKLLAVNTHLLSLINSGCRDILQHIKQKDGNDLTENNQDIIANDFPADHFLAQLHEKIKITQSERNIDEIREAFRDQLYRCLCQLELLRNGEGFLYQTYLTEGDAHKMDIYQLIQLLSFNIWKNIVQFEKLEAVYASML